MRFIPTRLPGVFLIEPERREDERGSFARIWCRDEAAGHGIDATWVQCNVSFNKQRGTLRGMHYQRAPYAEAKLVRVTQGAVFDVVLDLRPESTTYKQYFTVVLSAQNRLGLYIPSAHLPHGTLTLVDDTEVLYHMSAPYAPQFAAGVRWNDPAFAIAWPEPVRVISRRDSELPDFNELPR
jgi:dTDP-4-dehydrorhamnose 3,5-epimerase